MNNLKKINRYFTRNRLRALRITILTMLIFILISTASYFFTDNLEKLLRNIRLAGAILLIIISVHSLIIGFLSILTNEYVGSRFTDRIYGPIGIGRGAFWIGNRQESILHGIEAVSQGVFELSAGVVACISSIVLMISL